MICLSCGGITTPGAGNRPRKYCNSDCRNADRARLVAVTRAAKEAPNTIDMETFSAAIMEIKTSKNYTWRQMSVLSGRTMSHIATLGCSTGRKKSIQKDTAEDILRRLNGEHLSPTPFQVRQYQSQLQKHQREHRAETLKQRKKDERTIKLENLSLRLGSGEE